MADQQAPGAVSSSTGPRFALPSPRIGVPTTGRLEFLVFRNGKPLGRHEIRFSDRNGDLLADISVDYVVKLGPVNLFRYKLRGRETWSDGRLASAHVQTDNNGKQEYLSAIREGEALIVEGRRARRARPPRGSLIATHWNIAQLDGPMINPQDGSLMRFSVKTMGLSTLMGAKGGAARTAKRYGLSGQNPMELWYEDPGLWVGLRAKAFDGSIISYTLASS